MVLEIFNVLGAGTLKVFQSSRSGFRKMGVIRTRGISKQRHSKRDRHLYLFVVKRLGEGAYDRAAREEPEGSRENAEELHQPLARTLL